MRSILAGLMTLIIPWGALPGTPHVALGPDLRPELVTYFSVNYAKDVIFNELWWVNETDYYYEAELVDQGTPDLSVAHARGLYTNGTVYEVEFTQGLASGANRTWLLSPKTEILGQFGPLASTANVGTSTLTIGPSVDVAIDSRSIGRGLREPSSSTSNSSAIGTTETSVLSISNFVFRARRAYRISFGNKITCSGSTNVGTFRLRKTNASGTVWGDAGAFGPSPAAPDIHAAGEFFVRRVADTDLTAGVVLTLQASAGTVTQVGSATQPRYLLIEDVGSDDRWTHAVSIS